jgi:hypothetical protein
VRARVGVCRQHACLYACTHILDTHASAHKATAMCAHGTARQRQRGGPCSDTYKTLTGHAVKAHKITHCSTGCSLSPTQLRSGAMQSECACCVHFILISIHHTCAVCDCNAPSRESEGMPQAAGTTRGTCRLGSRPLTTQHSVQHQPQRVRHDAPLRRPFPSACCKLQPFMDGEASQVASFRSIACQLDLIQ